MAVQISDRAQRIQPSPTVALSMRAKEMKAAGKDVINLSVGEPDFDTPQHIKEAAMQALQEGQTKYTAVDGTPALKAAIIEKFKRDNALDYEPKEIIVSCGAKHSLSNLFYATLNPGDEVIIPAPYWVSYPAMAALTGATPVVVDTDLATQFKITAEQLEAAITERTRLFVLNSPSNPTGCVYHRDELEALGNVLLQHPHVVVVTDDIYEHLIWEKGLFFNIVQACPGLKSRAIVINGVSKAYAMTGWRIGYAAGPTALIGAMRKLQSQNTSNPCSLSQSAATAALSGDPACISDMVKAFKERHDIAFNVLSKLPGFQCLPSEGTFYLFPNIQEAMKAGGYATDTAFCEALLNEAEVAVVPGTAFGAPGHLRLSYAVATDVLEEALRRIQTFK